MSYTRMGLLWLGNYLLRAERKLRAILGPGVSRSVELEQLNGDQLTFATPVFVLSTGRCGTLWLTELLRLSRYLWVNHSDPPELIRHSRLAYERYTQAPYIFHEVIRAARDEYIVSAYKRGQTYVETNNRITFFAYAIKHVYPKAKFIHLVRHPGDFVRSGLSRNWYRGQRHDVGRITMSSQDEVRHTIANVERIAWLWNETNLYVEGFVRDLDPQDFIQINAEDMFGDPSVSIEICRFIGIGDISLNSVKRMLGRRLNRQRKWAVGPYQTWTEEKKQAVRRYAELAPRYGYEL